MHIIYTTKIYLPHIGGVELYIKMLADYFSKKGDTVTVITADEEISNSIEEITENITILRIPTKSIYGIYFLKNLKDLNFIKQKIKSADIVHVNDCKFLFRFFAKQKKMFHYRLICSSHGWLFHTKNHALLKKMYFKEFVAKNSKFFDKIICVSEQDKIIAEKMGMLCDTVISPGVDCKKYADLPEKMCSEDTFFYWGRIAKNKGILDALKKFNSLRNDYTFIIAGKCEDEEYMALLHSYISENKMEKNIKFVGQISDAAIKTQIEKSDYIILPSLHEGFGITLVECLLCGRPIIANTNDSYTTILNQVHAPEYLFDFESETSDLQQKISELKGIKIIPKNIEQF